MATQVCQMYGGGEPHAGPHLVHGREERLVTLLVKWEVDRVLLEVG
jgi:hypothetical protein